MNEAAEYRLRSDFLNGLVNDDVSLGDHAFGRANLARLVAMTRDADETNRDWATFLLASTSYDDERVRDALPERLNDPREETRLEALIGVAKREPHVALPRVQALLEGACIKSMVLEAAAFVADPALVRVLDDIAADWAAGRADEVERDGHMDWLVSEARAACAAGVQPAWRAD